MSEEMTNEQAIIAVAIKALEEQSKKVTISQIEDFLKIKFGDLNLTNLCVCIFKHFGLLKEEPPKEPEYQWLYKRKCDNYWMGCTDYKTKQMIEEQIKKEIPKYIYERIESSKR